MTWEDIVADKLARLDSTIPAEWRLNGPTTDDNVMDYPAKSSILTADELNITASSAVDLVAKMAARELTAVAVITAFSKRAAIAHQLTKCALELFPDLALARAQYLDDYLAKHGKTVGPLHGLPISLKDQFRVKGIETSMGYVGWLGKFETDNSTLVTLLLEAGAVFYVKTSVPQSLMSGETFNNITGRTVNPRNKNWTSGGSSGGEGALLALRGSVIGVGSDIGGSIRIPSAYNFLYGLRPSHGRVPYYNAANSMAGQETMHSVLGPLCHSVSDMRLFMKTVIGAQPWLYDSKVIPMPWRQAEEDAAKAKVSEKKLTIGYYSFDGIVHLHPPVLRAVEETVAALKKAGHNVVPWEPFKHKYAVTTLIGKIFSADGGADIYSDIDKSGEPAATDFARNVPRGVKSDLNDTWQTNLDRWQYQCEYLAAIREFEAQIGAELDAIITPASPMASAKHGEFKYAGYTSIINLLDFTSVIVPVTFADKNVDVAQQDFQPTADLDAGIQKDYNADDYHGAPVSLQVIGKRLSEEKTMVIAEEVGRLLGNEVAS